MSTKSAIKMINIQKSYSVHIVLFGPLGIIWSTLVLFYTPLFYSVHTGPIWSILSTLVPFWSFGPFYLL